MSLVLVDRCTARAASRKWLGKQVTYISDPTHPDHSGEKKKTIHPARSYNVPGNDQSPDAFIEQVIRLNEDYFNFRSGKLGQCSQRVFEEIICSTEKGAWLNQEERDEIERRIVSRFGGMAFCRAVWHVDEKTGRCDLHVILSAKNMDYPPKMTLWAEFGGAGGDHIYAVMDRLDVEITQYLNRTRERKRVKLVSAERRHREAASGVIGKQEPLAKELAKYFLNRKKPAEIDARVMVKAIESLGHENIGPVGRSILVRFRGRKKARRFNLNGLQDQTVVTLELLLRTDNPGSFG